MLKSTVLAIRGSPLKGRTVLPTRALVKTRHTVHSPSYKGAKSTFLSYAQMMYIPFIYPEGISSWKHGGHWVYVGSQSAPL